MNNKDIYWFTHDTNAKDDPKCAMMIEQFGPEAYGIFWILIEILREQPDFSYPLALLPSIARKYNTTKDKVNTVVTGYGLFEIRDDKFFYSKSLINRTIEFKEKKDKRSAAALKAAMARWDKDKTKALPEGQDADSKVIKNAPVNANAMQTQSERNANAMPIKKIKEIKDININPSSKDSGFSHPPVAEDTEAPLPLPDDKGQITEEELLSNRHCQDIVDFWNRKIKEHASQFQRVKLLTDKRKAKIRTRWKEFARLGKPVEVCGKLINTACRSKFLQGDNPRGWKADFDWLFDNDKNWVKVLEGNYDDRQQAQKPKSRIDQLQDDLDYIHNFFNGGQNDERERDTGVDDQ